MTLEERAERLMNELDAVRNRLHRYKWRPIILKALRAVRTETRER